jgi:hypothetical protein
VAHCPSEQLDDLADVLAEVRAWPGIVEKKAGVFYVLGGSHFSTSTWSKEGADVPTSRG